MKTLRLFIPITFLLFGFLTSCKTAETVAVVEEEIIETPPVIPQDSEDESTLTQVKEGDSLFAYIYRSVCFGKCPSYKMSIYSDGTVLLEGKRDVRLIGHYKAKISAKQMKMFSDMAASIEFYKMKDKYDSPITDVPSTTLSIVKDGYRKEVYARADYPQRIRKLAELFDHLLEKDIWTEYEDK